MEVFLPIAQVLINPVEILLLSAIVGVLSGLFGVGGGFLMTPFLIFMGVPPAYAVANEANNILATSVSGSTTHYLKNTLDYKMGFIIVIGGTIGSIMVAYPMGDLVGAMKSLSTVLKNPSTDPQQIITDILDLAQTARKESILALEKKRDSIAYEPLATAVRLAVDGTDPNVIRETLETAQHVSKEEQEVYVGIWETFGAIAPTIGILGAVLGLIHVMENLDKPDQIGPGIAIAFVATLYGVGSSNIFFIPIVER